MTLRLESVSYRYAGSTKPILRDVSVTLEAGRVVGVTGRSESGKSTLCLVASGLAPGVIGGTVDGLVELDGRDARGLPQHVLAQSCGILFQNPTTQLSRTARTVWEEIAFGPCNLGLAVADVVERVESTAETLAIGGLLRRDPTRLSGGQAQLVALAAVLALRPPHVVLDGGKVVRSGPTAAVQRDPSIAELGVEPPAAVRIERLAIAAGIRLEDGFAP